jgi:predicted Ser/Thr protein kinase
MGSFLIVMGGIFFSDAQISPEIHKKLDQLSEDNSAKIETTLGTLQVSKELDLVVKTFSEENIEDFNLESRILQLLQPFPFVQRLLGKDDTKSTLFLSYMGNPLSTENLPEDWRVQVDRIYAVLQQKNILHNNISQEKLFVKDGKIILTDFESSTPASPGNRGDDYYNLYLAVNQVLATSENSVPENPQQMSGLPKDKGIPLTPQWVLGYRKTPPKAYGAVGQGIPCPHDERLSLYPLQTPLKDKNVILPRIRVTHQDFSKWGFRSLPLWTPQINAWIDQVTGTR